MWDFLPLKTLTKHMRKINSRAVSAWPGKVLRWQVPVPGKRVSPQYPRVGLGAAALGSDSWPKAFIKARRWEQQGCHRGPRDEAVHITLWRGTALSDLETT